MTEPEPTKQPEPDPTDATMRADLLKVELEILNSKLSDTVDRLWKIRGLGTTLWTGAVGLGLGAAGKQGPILELLMVSLLLPLWFAWIDCTYQGWYRRVEARERSIVDFLNADPYRLPATGVALDLRSLRTGQFPVFDPGGNYTFGQDVNFRHRTGRLRSFFDTTPTFIYGSQFAVSAILVAPRLHPPWQSWFVGVAAVLVGAMLTISVLLRLRERKREKAS
jgi:hypothetical protein